MTNEIWVWCVSGNVIYAKHTRNMETLGKLFIMLQMIFKIAIISYIIKY